MDVMRWLGAVVVVVAACSGAGDDVVQAEGPEGDREAELLSASLRNDERTLVVNLDACNADNNRVTVNESAEAVTITVITDDPPGGHDCSDGVTVVLERPLGARQLVDGSTGQPVEVEDHPG